MNSNINIPWPGWRIVEEIGHGGYGSVYEIERDVFGSIEKAALKIVSIPKEEWEIKEDHRNGLTEQEISEKYRELLEQYKNEYVLMMGMKGQSNIVSCEDIFVEQQDNGYGYNIYIRMELLKPLNHIFQNKYLSENEVINIGKDICQAIKLCHSQNIIHRDIKPANILRSKYGNYKLGDFGVSRVMEQTTTATGIGTKGYAAPEVFQMKRYGKTADIYSLGIVLYWLLNEKRIPFMEEKETTSPSRLQRAILKRYNGEVFAPPKNGSDQLKEIVMKACAYEADDRYQSAEEMLTALESLKVNPAGVHQIESGNKSRFSEKEKYETKSARESTEEGSSKQGKYATEPVESSSKRLEKQENFGTELAGTEKRDNPGQKQKYGRQIVKSDQTEEAGEKTQPIIEDLSLDFANSSEVTGTSKKKKSKVSLLIGAVGVIVVLAGGILFATAGGKKREKIDPSPILVEATATPTPVPTAIPTPVPTAIPTPVPTATPTPEPTATPIPVSVTPDDIAKGDVVTFGRYEQDNDLTNGAEPIEWNVLDVQDGKALLISKYGLDAIAYDENYEYRYSYDLIGYTTYGGYDRYSYGSSYDTNTYTSGYNTTSEEVVIWETCTLRQWLNSYFMKSAFMPEEVEIIQTTTVTADENPEYDTDPGNDTEDQIFLLSINEAEHYFENNEARRCASTQYAYEQGAGTSDIYTIGGVATCCWWLRSPGDRDNDAAFVGVDGSVRYRGDRGARVDYDDLCVRPALWINLAS